MVKIWNFPRESGVLTLNMFLSIIHQLLAATASGATFLSLNLIWPNGHAGGWVPNRRSHYHKKEAIPLIGCSLLLLPSLQEFLEIRIPLVSIFPCSLFLPLPLATSNLIPFTSTSFETGPEGPELED